MQPNEILTAAHDIRSDVAKMGYRDFASQSLNSLPIRLGSSKSAYGQCQFEGITPSFIRLSKVLFAHNPERIDSVVRHELAHAIAGHVAGHNANWASICRAIGGTGEVRTPGIVPAKKYIGECRNGHHKFMDRLTEKALERISCGRCAPYYDSANRYHWTLNTQGLKI